MKKPIRPTAFAIIEDSRRRGGVRVAKVEIAERFDVLQCAAVQEFRSTNMHHFLPFTQLATPAKGQLRAKIRAFLTLSRLGPGSPAASQTVA
ncbi:MAG: hypothetical protein H7343_08245 [Undibacterium sp.]|nr:hypothetical protein [Opitutaceae bacterium]